MKYYECKEVAQITGKSRSSVQKWAQKQNLDYLGTDKRKIYIWTKEQIDVFKIHFEKKE